MKVLHFLPWYSPHVRGGTEVFLMDLARSQSRAGYEVHIICPNTRESFHQETIEGVPVTYFPFPYGLGLPSFLEGRTAHPTCADFADLVRRLDPDVLHLHGIYPHFLQSFERLDDEYRGRLILTVHLVNVICAKQTLIDRWNGPCAGKVDFAACSTCIASSPAASRTSRVANRLTIAVNEFAYRSLGTAATPLLTPAQRRVDAQVRVVDFLRAHARIDVLSPWFRRVLAVNGFAPDRISGFDNPLFDRRNFSATRARLEGPVRFLFVGRLTQQKGIGLILDALAVLEPLKERFSIAFVGRAEDEWARRVDAMRAHGFRLELRGEATHGDMHAHYRANDYLLFASLSGEMLPQAVQEALVNDLPVVGADLPATRALVHDDINGILFPAGDSGALGDLMRGLIEGRKGMGVRYTGPRDLEGARHDHYDRLYRKIRHGRP